MNRQQIYRQIEETVGVVPDFLKAVPEDQLESEWLLCKKIEMEDGPIPQKYRHLMGLAISAVTKCKYCLYFHTELAKAFGASDAEIEATAHFAKSSVGWSAYISGLQLDFEKFKQEVRQACEHIRAERPVAGVR